jgi:hypothetical protein
MAKKRQRGNGAGTVYPRKNRNGKVTGYRGSYFTPEDAARTFSSMAAGKGKARDLVYLGHHEKPRVRARVLTFRGRSLASDKARLQADRLEENLKILTSTLTRAKK